MSAVTKVAKSTGRNRVSALPQRATADSDFLRILADIAFHHRCRSKGLCLRSPARRLPRPLAPATAGVFRSYRHPPKPSPRVAHPLKPSPWGVLAVLNDTPVACQTREPTDPQGDRCPHIPAASAATYPLRCFAPQWARFDNRHSTSAPTPTLTAVSGSGAGIVSRPGASAFFVSDGDNFAPPRKRFFCLRRPHFFQQRKKWGKERRQKLRFCTSSARYACSLPPALSLT